MAKCSRLGCLSPAIGQGRCEAHGGQKRTYKRTVLDYHELYNTKRWKDMRWRQLHLKPLCQRCKQYGYTKPATDVDHIQSHKGDQSIFYSSTNLQSLCHSCHSWKTQQESKRPGSELDWSNN